MKSSANGFVLIVMLVFLQIITLLGMYRLTANLLEIKMNHELLDHDHLYEIAKHCLMQVEHTASPTCNIPVTPIRVLLTKPLSWWQSRLECMGKYGQVQYYYVREVINDASPMKYYRITMIAYYHKTRVELQNTLVKVDNVSN